MADKVPFVDSAWDSVHTFIRPLGAAGIGVGILPGIAGKLAEISSLEVVPIILFTLSIVIAGLYELTVSRRLQARLLPATT